MKNALKITIITVLAVLSVLQTSRLWFEDRSLSDIFQSFNFTNGFHPSEDELNMLRTPSRLLVSAGDRSFVLKMNGLKSNELLSHTTKLVTSLLKSGEPGEMKGFKAAEVFADGAIVLVYEFGMSAEVFTEAHGSKSSLLDSRFEDFKYLTIVSNENGVKMTFSGDLYMYDFMLSIQDNELNGLMAEAAAGRRLVYKLDLTGGLFESYALVPIWTGDSYEYRNVNVSNPFAVNESVTRNSFESKAAMYFDNQSSLWLDNPNDIYTLSDENTIVKYYSSGLLEYSSYKSARSRVVNSFLSAFSAAYQIIISDAAIENEVYLAEYSYDGEAWQFGFDIALNDMPFFFSNELREELGLEHFIEITVSDDVVTKFRRFVAAYESDESFYSLASIQLSEFIEPIIEGGGDGDRLYIRDIELGYRIERSRQLSPYWKIYISGVPPALMPLD